MAFPERVETERLLLRRLEESDRDAFGVIWSDPEVWRPLGAWAAPGEEFVHDRLRHHLEHWRVHGFGLWAVLERGSHELAGWVGPAHPSGIAELEEEVEIGWTLRPSFRGRGLATDSARIAVEVGFSELAAPRVISLVHSSNERSIAVTARLGMRHESDVLHPALGQELRVYELRRGGGAATVA